MPIYPQLSHRAVACAAAGALALALTACSGGGSPSPKASGGASDAASDGHTDHHHGPAPGSASGLKAAADGYRLVPVTESVAAGKPYRFHFRIEKAAGGGAVTAFVRDQTKLMHVYAARSDHTGFQHVHPEMAADGTWSVPLDAAEPGWWRLYGSFIPKESGKALVLSVPYQVPGDVTLQSMPEPSRTAEADGYTLTVGGAPLKAGRAGALTMKVTRDGEPVTGLRPYLGSYAHVSAFHEGDSAFAHLHPVGEVKGTGGPELRFRAQLPDAGRWRLFVQFRTGGELHTAAITLEAG